MREAGWYDTPDDDRYEIYYDGSQFIGSSRRIRDDLIKKVPGTSPDLIPAPTFQEQWAKQPIICSNCNTVLMTAKEAFFAQVSKPSSVAQGAGSKIFSLLIFGVVLLGVVSVLVPQVGALFASLMIVIPFVAFVLIVFSMIRSVTRSLGSIKGVTCEHCGHSF